MPFFQLTEYIHFFLAEEQSNLMVEEQNREATAATSTRKRAPQKCKKCGQPRKGHRCNMETMQQSQGT